MLKLTRFAYFLMMESAKLEYENRSVNLYYCCYKLKWLKYEFFMKISSIFLIFMFLAI